MSRTASTPTVDIAYDAAGSGPPLVLLHAGVTDRHLWDSMVAPLADRFTVFVPDLRGFGETRVTAPGPWSLHEDLTAYLDAVDVDRAHLCGVSMGGAAALHAALESPERADHIVLINPALYGFRVTDAAVLEDFAAIDAAIESGDLDRAALLETAMWLAGPTRSLDDTDSKTAASMHHMLKTSYALDKGGEERPPDPMPAARLGEVTAPTLVVRGTRDIPHVIEATRRLAAEIPGAGLLEVDAAHLPPFEVPDELTDYLLDFLE